MKASQSLLAGAVVAVLAQFNTAYADTRVQASSGLQYSDGEYGETTSTSALVVPFSVRATFGAWSIRASVPYVMVDGPADVSEIIDDSSGRGTSSGSGSSGSGSGSGTSGRDGSGSGSGGSGGGDDDDPVDLVTADRSESGIGDASIALTYSLDSIGDSPAYVDFTGRVRLPTGSEEDGLGVGATDYVALSEIGWDGEAGGAFVSAGRRFLGAVDDIERVDGWQASVGGWINVSDSAVVGAYYDWRNSSVRDGEDPSSVEAYVSWRLNDAWKVEVNGGVGLSDASADYTAGLTLIWRSAKR
ncbi:MAG TPA: hypothetical protein VN705_08540 [Steroidobacteraceae bacterium]|jgi:hypothetical protein|nr:hypothetical protein [Steroidobacteraceae bacterium]